MPTNLVTFQQQYAQSGSWLIPLLVGGGLALVGTFVSQCVALLAGRIERRYQLRRLHLAKLEELADCVASLLTWNQKLSSCRTISDVHAAQPLESRRMVCLALIYFPALYDTVADYSNGLVSYYNFAVDCHQEGSPMTLGAQIALHPQSAQWTGKLLLLRQAVDDAIVKAAQRYTSA